MVLGNWGSKGKFLGEQGTKTILGNMEHKKTNFRFLGNRGTSQFISGEQGNRYPLGGPQCLCHWLLLWLLSVVRSKAVILWSQ